MSPTTAGSLLDQFARLAASVTGTSAAVIDLLGRRSDPAPVRAVFGLTRQQAEMATWFDAALQPSSGLTVLPDLTQDARFTPDGLGPANDGTPGLPPPRFLAHQTLLSPGGERVGFLCVWDPGVRAGLTEAQAMSFSHVADLIMADRKREQRHLHLMHVANRALRVDRMLRIVSEANSCANALTGIVEELCRFHNAAVGRIWQLTLSNGRIHEISRYNPEKGSHLVRLPPEPADTLNFVAADTVRFNKPRAITYSQLEVSERLLLADAIASGLASQVSIPVWLQQQRFGISLAFTTERPDLNEVVADVASLANTIRPALFRKLTEDRIRHVAHHDDLTQLSNRLMFQERLNEAFAAARRGEGLALLYLDLDGFKLVNDIRGHEVGDKLLAAVAQRLRHNVREVDTVARIGGDEFAIIQLMSGQPLAATVLAERLLETIRQPFNLDGQQSAIGVSIGIAIYPMDGETPDLMLRNADTALYRAKEAGRDTYRLFSPSMNTRQQERLLIEQELAGAIETQQFTLAYQPIRDGLSLDVLGFEALLRWRHPSRGLVQPGQFIPLAESSGLIVPLGQWVLEAACAEAAVWEPPATVSVNLSPLQFRQPDLAQWVADVLHRTGLPAGRLDLEVTEGVLLDASGVVLHTMEALREQGVRITLDDFGTAYASLSYLRRFPFDRIKIDQSFVRGMCDDDSTLAIVQAIISLGKRLNLAVVAEGIETERELDMLRKLDCRIVQGFLVGRPMADEQARALLAQLARPGGRKDPSHLRMLRPHDPRLGRATPAAQLNRL